MVRWEKTVDRTRVGKVADYVCSLRVEPTGFPDRLDLEVRGAGVEDDAMIFALSHWKDGNAIN